MLLMVGFSCPASWSRPAPPGRVTLLDFRAITCGPCRPALTRLQALHVRYPKLLVQGINMDSDETRAEVKPLLREQGVTYPERVAPAANARLAQAFGVQTYPALFLLSSQGRVVWSHSGPLDARAEDALSRRIAQALTAPAKVVSRPGP